jgi:DNA modification methylase
MFYKDCWIERDYNGSLIAFVDDEEDFYSVDAVEKFGLEVVEEFTIEEENERIGYYLARRYGEFLPASISDYWR